MKRSNIVCHIIHMSWMGVGRAVPSAANKGTWKYDTIVEFNMDWKAECGQLKMTHITKKIKMKLPI